MLQKIISLGHDYVVLKDEDYADDADWDNPKYFFANFESRDSIIAGTRQLPRIDGLLWIYENYVVPSAWIARELGIHGMPIQSAEACTDKYLMRSLFADAPEKISPDFAIATNETDVIDFAKSHDFPLILKPANLVKSLLVTKSNDFDDLLANYSRTTEQITSVYEKYAPHRKPKLIIEEFLSGSVHSVDAFVTGDGTPHVLENIVDYQTGYDIGYEDNFHYSRLLPSALSAKDQAAIRHCAELGIHALGMRNSPAHIEIILTHDGPRIVEIGARNGGYRERMHRLANGTDIIKNAIAVALNEQPDILPTKNYSCAVIELFPKSPGKFQGIHHENQLRKLDSFRSLATKTETGRYTGRAADGYKMCAVTLLLNRDSETFAKDLAYIREHVSVQTT